VNPVTSVIVSGELNIGISINIKGITIVEMCAKAAYKRGVFIYELYF
tara:strand:+ start:902 stop:1042 length:141 start_codon:yes stop_codon:yes gene_type:complete